MELEELQEEKAVFFEQDGSNFYQQVEYLEKLLINSGSPDVIIGNSDELPLTHNFCDGIYTREIIIKKRHGCNWKKSISMTMLFSC